MPDHWLCTINDDIASLFLDPRDDRWKLMLNHKVIIAIYNEKTQRWYGSVNGQLISVEWFNLKTLFAKFGVQDEQV